MALDEIRSRKITATVGRFLGALLIASLIPAIASTPATWAQASSAGASAAAQSAGLLTWELAAYRGPLGPYRDGIWSSPNSICWSCNQGGPASAAATLFMLTGESRPDLLLAAEGTIDTAIATRQRPSGAFIGPTGDTQSPDVATMFFGVEEGNTYLELLPRLDPARRARWQASIAGAASFLIHNGNLSWYTNGNINLGNTELFYLAWRATENPAFHAAYEQAWSFTLRPPQTSWPGRGLVLVGAPRRADGADGTGYLTETGPGGTGFDPEYAELQLDVACRLYLLSGDPRALRLANLLLNMLLPRISSTFRLDTSSGTRHTERNRKVGVLTSAFVVLGLDGGRARLVPLIGPELRETTESYLDPSTNYGAVYRRGLGNDVSVIAIASSVAHPVGWATRTQVFSSYRGRVGPTRQARCPRTRSDLQRHVRGA